MKLLFERLGGEDQRGQSYNARYRSNPIGCFGHVMSIFVLVFEMPTGPQLA